MPRGRPMIRTTIDDQIIILLSKGEISADELCKAVYGTVDSVYKATLNVHLTKLRHKINRSNVMPARLLSKTVYYLEKN